MENEEQREYSIGELADEVGVSTRTIRYYVSEGLLPPPVGVGPNSHYTNGHRRQLEIIGRLKAEYLPLKEIRRRLIGHGLNSANVPPMADTPPPPAGRRKFKLEVDLSRKKGIRGIADSIRISDLAKDAYLSKVMSAPPPELELHEPDPDYQRDQEQTWRRVAISDEAELMITEQQYRRHQDKIEWLVQWAKRVFES